MSSKVGLKASGDSVVGSGVLNVAMHEVIHQAIVRVDVPIQSRGQVGDLAPGDVLIVQIQEGPTRDDLPCTGTALLPSKGGVRTESIEHARPAAVVAVLSGEEKRRQGV